MIAVEGRKNTTMQMYHVQYTMPNYTLPIFEWFYVKIVMQNMKLKSNSTNLSGIGPVRLSLEKTVLLQILPQANNTNVQT